MKPRLQIPAEISKVMTMSDDSLRLYIDTQQLSNEDAAMVMLSAKKLGYMLFQEVEFTEDEDIDMPKLSKPSKASKSSLLRKEIWKYWKDKTNETTEFEIYYDKAMDKLINSIKEKL